MVVGLRIKNKGKLSTRQANTQRKDKTGLNAKEMSKYGMIYKV